MFLKDDYALEQLGGWDTLGMRGTCSAGFRLEADRHERAGPARSLRQDSRADHDARSRISSWSVAWAGIAAAAVERARAFVRKAPAALGRPTAAGAAHLTRANAVAAHAARLIAGALTRYESADRRRAALESLDFQTAINLLKVEASELAVATVMSAMRACGLSGYRNDSEFSLGRHLRDVLSSPIMISNDRILANVGTATLLGGVPSALRD